MIEPFRLLDLFSGIGGFSLGLERTGGFRTMAFCEIEPFCRRVLAKHWPEVPCYHDIQELTDSKLLADGIEVDAICGGFPCQDISASGKRVGITGKRSGLWSHYRRIIGEIRPRYVIVENVADLLVRGMDVVLGDLARLRYDAEWQVISSAACGAPHIRERVWIVAYPQEKRTIPCMESIRPQRGPWQPRRSLGSGGLFWVDHPPVCGVDDGLRPQLDGHETLGNAVVPQIPEMIGRAILEAHRG